MEMEVDLYLASLASDSARWKRLGRVGTLNFVEGVLESLMATGAITRDEALAWKDLLAFPSGGAFARSDSSAGLPVRPLPPTHSGSANFIDLLTANEPAKVLPGVCSFQILGLERYDVQLVVVWRMLPSVDLESSDELKHLAPFMNGPEMSSMEVTDDRGTLYQMRGGTSGGGGGETVGRYIYNPAPPEEATVLTINWEGMNFEIPLGLSHG